MKKYCTIALIALSMNCFADASSDLKKMKELTLQGFKAIRHDALIRFNFRKAHEMKIEIKKLEAEINNG